EPRPRQWDEESYFVELERKFSPAEVVVARRILDWAFDKVTEVRWGKGSVHGSFYPVIWQNEIYNRLFIVYSNGYIETSFQHYRETPTFRPEEKRLELLARLNMIPGVSW